MISSHNLKPKIVWKGHYLSLIKKGDWEYVERHNCSGVVIIVAVTKQNKVLFVEQYRPPVNRKVVEFPAGLVNDQKMKGKETAGMAARRELLEETGYRAGRMIKMAEGSAGGGLTSDNLTIYMAYDIKKIAFGGGDETENLEVFEIPLDKVERWLQMKRKRGSWIDPKIYAGLYFINKYN